MIVIAFPNLINHRSFPPTKHPFKIPRTSISGMCLRKQYFILRESIVVKMLWYYRNAVNTGRLLITVKLTALVSGSRLGTEIWASLY